MNLSMFGFKAVRERRDVSVENISVSNGPGVEHPPLKESGNITGFLHGLILGLLVFLPCTAMAFTTITLSSSAPAAVEQALLKQTTTQFNATVLTNPFFPNTYQVILYGLNPNYNPPPTDAQLLNSIVTVDSYTYVYGWAQGSVNARNCDMNIVATGGIACSTDTVCANVASQILNNMFIQCGSTTPVVVPNF